MSGTVHALMSNRLSVLATDIRAAHEDVARSSRLCAERAVDAGRMLAEAKASDDIPRGGWERWVEDVAGVPYRTAQRYIQLFVAVQDESVTIQDIAEAGQIGALKAAREQDDDGDGIYDDEAAENHRAKGTGDNEWFTPAQYVAAARKVMGAIDLDPATHPVAQEAIQATEFFTREDDALSREWHGRVWLNPPYAQPLIGQFIDKLVSEIEAGRVKQAVLLTHNYTDTAWFHAAQAHAALICFTRGRIKFLDPDGEDCAPTQGQAFFYYGPRIDRFRREFVPFGFVMCHA